MSMRWPRRHVGHHPTLPHKGYGDADRTDVATHPSLDGDEEHAGGNAGAVSSTQATMAPNGVANENAFRSSIGAGVNLAIERRHKDWPPHPLRLTASAGTGIRGDAFTLASVDENACFTDRNQLVLQLALVGHIPIWLQCHRRPRGAVPFE